MHVLQEQVRQETLARFPEPKALAPPSPEELAAQEAERIRQEEMHANQRRCASWHHLIEAVGRRYKNATFAAYEATHNKQRAAVKALRDYAVHWPEHAARGKGIVLFGPSGTGKDHLLLAVARCILEEHKHYARFHWANGPALFSQLRDAMDGGESEERILRDYRESDVLILSDPTPPRGALTEYQASVLYTIIDERYRRNRPTWASINVASGKEADERLGAPIVDRLRHGALVLHFDWPTYRNPGIT